MIQTKQATIEDIYHFDNYISTPGVKEGLLQLASEGDASFTIEDTDDGKAVYYKTPHGEIVPIGRPIELAAANIPNETRTDAPSGTGLPSMDTFIDRMKSGATGEAKAINPSMRKKISSSVQEQLESFGMDRYRARKLSESLFGGESSGVPMGLGLIDFVPIVGTALQSEEAGIKAGEAFDLVKDGKNSQAAAKYGEAVLTSIPGAIATKKVIGKTIDAGVDAVKSLAPSVGKMAEEYLSKSDLKRLPENQRDTLIGLYDKALETKPEFDSIGQEIASQINGEYMAVPIKKSGRLVDKALGDYNGDVTKTKDLVRSTIIVDTPEQAAQVLNLIRQRFSVRSENFRNLLDESVDAPLGYRDAKMNVEINGTVAEIQVNFREMLKAKKELYPLYEELRKLERTIMSRPDKAATSKELARIETLEAKQKAGYDAAFSEVIKRLNISSETSAPLRRAESGSNGLGGETSQAAQYGTALPAPIETGMPSTSKNLVPFENSISKTSNKSLSDLATDVKGTK
jgi:hypothetical protein